MPYAAIQRRLPREVVACVIPLALALPRQRPRPQRARQRGEQTSGLRASNRLLGGLDRSCLLPSVRICPCEQRQQHSDVNHAFAGCVTEGFEARERALRPALTQLPLAHPPVL